MMKQTSVKFQFTSFSLRHPNKSKCGDTSFSEVLKINGEDCAVLMVADGVSSAPKDWLASRSTINFVKEYLISNQESIGVLLKDGILYANDKVIAGVYKTLGMLTTLSILIHQPSSQKIYWANVGDSRIYGYRQSDWEQLTVDDSTSQLYLENGKMRFRDGAPIMMSVITKAIGTNHALKINAHEVDENEYTGLLLCSDGFYSLPGFIAITNKLYKVPDMEKESAIIKETVINDIVDDASMALLRFNKAPDFDIQSLVMGNLEDSKSLPAFMLTNALEQELEMAIGQGDDQYVEKILSFMATNNFTFSRERMIELLEGMIAIKSRHIVMITGMIRRL